jgi:transcriptional regulator of acetoin/glycerol metabolism
VRLNASSVTRFVEAARPRHPARWAIVASWDRCAHLSPHGTPEFHRIDDDDLASRLAQNALLIEAALPRLDRLLAHAGGNWNIACLTDATGVILASGGSPARLRELRLTPGYDWSEGRMGTNGAGTCLVTGRPIVVAAAEHYLSAFHDCTCTAAPIRGPGERMMGALDLMGDGARSRGAHIARVTAAALEIEATLARC